MAPFQPVEADLPPQAACGTMEKNSAEIRRFQMTILHLSDMIIASHSNNHKHTKQRISNSILYVIDMDGDAV